MVLEYLLIYCFIETSGMTASKANKAAIVFASEATYTFDESYEDEDANDAKSEGNCEKRHE